MAFTVNSLFLQRESTNDLAHIDSLQNILTKIQNHTISKRKIPDKQIPVCYPTRTQVGYMGPYMLVYPSWNINFDNITYTQQTMQPHPPTHTEKNFSPSHSCSCVDVFINQKYILNMV